ncbi:MAG: hypothetical protein JWM64_103 [Frankiales bacterium]|nr:hypothetical protein [Frankiales bacterium]
MTSYEARVRREGRWWVAVVDGVGATQGRSLKELESMVRDMVVLMDEVDEDQVDVRLEVDLGGGLQAKVHEAREATAKAERMQREAAAQAREVARALRGDAALTGKDTAYLLGVSEQRVSQLVPRAV